MSRMRRPRRISAFTFQRRRQAWAVMPTYHYRFFAVLVATLAALLSLPAASRAATAPFELKDGDRVVFLGDTFIEREQKHGWIELMLTTRFPDRNVTFRNLGWSADLPTGESRLGLSLLQAGHEPAGEAWKLLQQQLKDAQPTVVFLGYGMASSFAGPEGLPQFKADYLRLLDTLNTLSPGVRFVLLSPLKHESLPAPFPRPDAHNEVLKSYMDTIEAIAAQRGGWFVNLFQSSDGQTKLTDNGIHLNDAGYRVIASRIERALFGSDTKAYAKAAAEPLRQVILRKNEFFFHRSRPANMAYIFGFRKGEQGRNSVEMPKFDPLIAEEETKIARLRSLSIAKPGPELQPAALRTSPAAAKLTPQPHPEFTVADGFEVTLWAENPHLAKPIQINFDPRGRLWVASSEVYPQIEPGQAAHDKILILEDSNGDGKADRSTIFAEGLLIPTGIEPGDGGCYVAQSTELLHFKDSKGTGKADSRRVVLSSFGTEDTHHNLHTLRWGMDGRLWMNQSIYTRSEVETPRGVVRLRSGGIFRFDPRSQDLSVVYKGWVNAWGHQFDEFGQSFVTDGAGGGGINWGLPGAMYEAYARARRTLPSVSPGGYPKFASIEIVYTPQFPDDWQGRMITCDFRANRVTTFSITDRGAGYITRQETDLLRTKNNTFRPIDAKIGPDGALYIADWSNPIINHGEVDFRDPRRDHEHGRIWRVAYKGKPALKNPNLINASDTALLKETLSPSSFNRAQARRVLQERGSKVLPSLARWTQSLRTEQELLGALWMHQALNQPNPALLQRLLTASDARVRAAVTRVLGEWNVPVPTTDAFPAPPIDRTLKTLSTLVADENPRVRLEAVRVLSRIPNPRAAELVLSVLDKPMDNFLDYAVWLSINDLAPVFLAALESQAWTPNTPAKERQLDFAMRAIEPGLSASFLAKSLTGKPLAADGSGPWIELIGSAGDTAALNQLFKQAVEGQFKEPALVRALNALREAARVRNARPSGTLSAFGSLMNHPDAAVRLAAVRLAGEFKDLGTHFGTLVTQASNPASAAPLRAAAFESLRQIGGPGVIEALKPLTTESSPQAVRQPASILLAHLQPETFAPLALRTLAEASEADAPDLWRSLLSTKGIAKPLAPMIQQSALPAGIALAGLRVAREAARPDPTLIASLTTATTTTLTPEQITPEFIKQLAAQATKEGDAAHGERVFRRAQLGCLLCHSVGGVGGKVGPDMTSLGASAPVDYLVESLLLPNAKIKEGFHSITLETKDDQEFSGILVRETAQELFLRNAQNQEISVSRANIRRRSNGQSLMPSGLIDTLPAQDRLDLIRFLSELGKQGNYDASKGGVARVWNIVPAPVGTDAARVAVAGKVEGLPDWKPILSRVNGSLAGEDIAEITPAGDTKSGLIYARTEFQATKAGPITFDVESTGAVEIWIDGTLRPVQAGKGNNSTVTAALQPGTHRIVVKLNGDQLPKTSVLLRSRDVSWAQN